MGRSLPAGLLGLVLATGCVGGIQKTIRPPKEPLQLTTAFVYPFGFRWEEPVYRRFELSERLLQVAIGAGGDRLAFFGPGEFSVLKANDDGAWVASTALPLLTGSGQRPEQGVIIRPWAERRTNSSVQEALDKRGKSKGLATMEQTTYLAHVEVVHPSSGQVLVEVSGEVTVDPFSSDVSPEDEFDRSRQLTQLMATLVRTAVEAIRDFTATGRNVRPDLGLTVALTPKATLEYVEPDTIATQTEVAGMDAMTRELFLQDRAKFLAPFLSDAEVQKVVKMPVGLYVAAAAPTSKVEAGDLLLSIDGEPAIPERLARLRFSEVPVQVRVRRASGEETEVVLP